MNYSKVNLKETYPQLGPDSVSPILEVYLTENLIPDTKRPVMLVCPGGGYGFCSRREAEQIAIDYLPLGFNVFVLTYTVAPARFPTQIREVAAAMELIYSKSEEWACDTEKVAIMGFSAGAHLASHYSTMFDCKEVREIFPESKPVNASLLCYPVITADEGYSHSGSFENLVGHYPLSDEELNRFSTDRCVKDNTPPAFLWHNSGDGAVPVMNSWLYAQTLAKYGIPVELHVFPNGCHGLSTCDKRTNGEIDKYVEHSAEWMELSKKWLKLTFEL